MKSILFSDVKIGQNFSVNGLPLMRIPRSLDRDGEEYNAIRLDVVHLEASLMLLTPNTVALVHDDTALANKLDAQLSFLEKEADEIQEELSRISCKNVLDFEDEWHRLQSH